MSRADRASREELAEAAHHGVLPRTQLVRLGWDRDAVARQVAAGRWALHGRRTVALHCGPIPPEAMLWRAVWESGAGAVLDGVSALHAAGMTGFVAPHVHVSIGHRARRHQVSGVVVHRVRQRVDAETLVNGVPRVRPAIAAIRAARWAVSDRQAALLLVLPVQQRIVTADQLAQAADQVGGRTRRALIGQLVRDIASGAQSLGELDFAAMCRRRGLPEPTRQVLRRGPRGKIYLDVEWEDIGLVVEIDGSQHVVGMAPTDDALRSNAVVLGRRMVLRMTLLGLRLTPEEFMDQVCEAHRQRSNGRRLAG
jgi:very-short-patch-repair endonuclease